MPAHIRRRRALGSRSPFAACCFLRCARATRCGRVGGVTAPREFRFPTSHTQGVRCVAWQADVVVAGLPAVWPSCPMEHGGDANSGPRPVGVSPSIPIAPRTGTAADRGPATPRAYRSQRGRNVLLMFPDASLRDP